MLESVAIRAAATTSRAMGGNLRESDHDATSPFCVGPQRRKSDLSQDHPAHRAVPLPLLLAAYLDRVNVGFAKLQMQKELAFSETVYGFGAGIFFLGYVLFEVPSNIILHRVGARLWLARVMPHRPSFRPPSRS
jgi:hypothetical protein